MWHQHDRDPENVSRFYNDDNPFAKELRSLCDLEDPSWHEQFLYKLPRSVIVEPLHGFVCSGSHVLAFLQGIDRYVAEQAALPFRLKIVLQPKQHVARAVLFRHHYAELNYFHFLNDILSKLTILDRFPEYRQWPWIVSRAQFQTPYFQGFLQRLKPRTPEIIVQDEVPIEVEELVCVKGMGLTPSWIAQARAILHVSEAPPSRQEKIFLFRNNTTRDVLGNSSQVRDLCEQHGFRAVDTATLTLDEQIELFRNIRFIIAEHGAGLTNLIFRGHHPLGLLELYPPHCKASCYYALAKQLGHDYLGQPMQSTTSQGLQIDLEALAKNIRILLNNSN